MNQQPSVATSQSQPQQANGTPRPVNQPVQGVSQIRAQPVPQVNISQQPRIPMVPAATAAPMSHQMLQAHAAQTRALATAIAQPHTQLPASTAQAQGQAHVQMQAQAATPIPNPTQNGLSAGTHLSPSYQPHTAVSSPNLPPQASPSHSVVTNATSPVPLQLSSQGSVTALPRLASSIPAQFLPVVPTTAGQFTQEHMEQAMRLMQQVRQGFRRDRDGDGVQQRQGTLAQAQQGSHYPSQA